MPGIIEAKFLSPLGEDALLFRRMHGREQLGRIPEYHVELLRPSDKEPVIKPADLLGAKAGVEVEAEDKKYRYFNGIVTRFERGGVRGRYDVYRVELRPWLWQLSLGQDCRIFQDMTAMQVIEKVFADYSTAGPIEKEVKATLRKRPYVVQYRESDLAFVSRLMEEEGIYYYFKYSKGQHTLVLADNPSAHKPMPGEKLDWAHVQTDHHLRENIITHWKRTHSLGSLKYTHTEYAPDAPAMDLKTEALRTTPYPKPGDLEVFDYPGGYEDLSMDEKAGARKTEGTRLAKKRVDAFESQHDVIEGQSPWRYLSAGYTLELSDHPSDNGKYLITLADFEMEFAGYEANRDQVSKGYSCRFEGVSSALNYMPQSVTPRPLISGPQTAVVTGPSGDEIHTDKFGRVKVQFHWDRVGTKNEKSSCWVRVSTPWASKQFGMIALPRVGDEVVVEFMEGNPDRPLITGSVYNAVNLPPWELPAQATVSGIKSQSSKKGDTKTFNELRFDDKKGSEYVWFQAEKDYHHWVKNDAFVTIENDHTSEIVKKSSNKVGDAYTMDIGKTASVKIKEDTDLQVGGDLKTKITGATDLDIGQALTLKAGAAMKVTAGAAGDIDIGAALNISAAASVHIKGLGVVIDGGTQLCIKAGGAFITLGPDGVSIQGTMVKINSGGAAGSANAAAKASPAAPQDPPALAENKDALAFTKKK